MPDIKRPIFFYEPLDKPSDNIGLDRFRLIHLYPLYSIEDQVECTMEIASLRDYDSDFINQYVALSYVWGSSTETRDIIVNGCTLTISASLESTLRNIRHWNGFDVLRLWVDAICVNQADNEERSDQVRRMGAIYSVARRTIIYLGDSNEGVDLAFTTSKALVFPEKDNSLSDFGHQRKDILQIWKEQVFNRSWFSRIWIFQ
jgi:hypothetical protein